MTSGGLLDLLGTGALLQGSPEDRGRGERRLSRSRGAPGSLSGSVGRLRRRLLRPSGQIPAGCPPSPRRPHRRKCRATSRLGSARGDPTCWSGEKLSTISAVPQCFVSSGSGVLLRSLISIGTREPRLNPLAPLLNFRPVRRIGTLPIKVVVALSSPRGGVKGFGEQDEAVRARLYRWLRVWSLAAAGAWIISLDRSIVPEVPGGLRAQARVAET